MWSDVIMVNLVAFEYLSAFAFQSSHCLFSVSDFSVHAFHLVIVMLFSLESNLADMVCSFKHLIACWAMAVVE